MLRELEDSTLKMAEVFMEARRCTETRSKVCGLPSDERSGGVSQVGGILNFESSGYGDYSPGTQIPTMCTHNSRSSLVIQFLYPNHNCYPRTVPVSLYP